MAKNNMVWRGISAGMGTDEMKKPFNAGCVRESGGK